MSNSPTQKWPRFMWAVVHNHRIQTENKPHVNNTEATVTPSSECEPSQEHGSLEAAGPVESYLIETVQGLGVKKHEGPPGYILWHGMCAQCFCDEGEENISPEHRVPCFNLLVCSSIEQKGGKGKIICTPLLVSFTEPNSFPSKPKFAPASTRNKVSSWDIDSGTPYWTLPKCIFTENYQKT